jgi:hypothetical protein
MTGALTSSRVLRAGVVLLGLTIVTACGGGSAPGSSPAPTPTATTPSTGTQGQGSAAQPPARPAPIPTAVVHAPVPTAVAVVIHSGTAQRFRLVGLDGATLATSLTTDLRGVAGGPGFALVVTADRLQKLTAGGVVDAGQAGPMAQSYLGIAVAPDGKRWAFSTRTENGTAFTNRLYVAGDGLPAHVIAERQGSTTAAAPSADAPSNWEYHVVTWVPQGIVIGRVPHGIGGCGGELGVDRNTAFVDPATGTSTAISNDQRSWLSSVAVDGTAVLFHTTSSGTADGIRLWRGGSVVGTATLSGQNVAGSGLYDPVHQALAYATVDPGIDCSTWETAMTLRVLRLPTGAATAVGPSGLQPLAWMPDGSLLAQHMVPSTGQPALGLVEVSASGAVRDIGPGVGDAWVGGVVTAA